MAVEIRYGRTIESPTMDALVAQLAVTYKGIVAEIQAVKLEQKLNDLVVVTVSLDGIRLSVNMNKDNHVYFDVYATKD